MKKIMALLLVGTMVLGLLTGCGKKDKEPDKDNGKIENDDTGKEDGSEDGKDDEPAEIVELKAYFGATKPDDDTLKAVNDAVNKYLEEKIGAHLEMVFEDFGAITETMTMEMGRNILRTKRICPLRVCFLLVKDFRSAITLSHNGFIIFILTAFTNFLFFDS